MKRLFIVILIPVAAALTVIGLFYIFYEIKNIEEVTPEKIHSVFVNDLCIPLKGGGTTFDSFDTTNRDAIKDCLQTLVSMDRTLEKKQEPTADSPLAQMTFFNAEGNEIYSATFYDYDFLFWGRGASGNYYRVNTAERYKLQNLCKKYGERGTNESISSEWLGEE